MMMWVHVPRVPKVPRDPPRPWAAYTIRYSASAEVYLERARGSVGGTLDHVRCTLLMVEYSSATGFEPGPSRGWPWAAPVPGRRTHVGRAASGTTHCLVGIEERTRGPKLKLSGRSDGV
jgi:hypothetical protein